MLNFIPLKKTILGLFVVFAVYYLIAIGFLASARAHELIAYQIINPKGFVDGRALPIPFGKYFAKRFLIRKSNEEISQIFLYDIFLMPEELKLEGRNQGYSMDHGAVAESFSIASLLIELGVDVNAKNNYGCTSLHLAVKDKNLEAVRFLQNHNANPMSVDDRASREFCKISPAKLAEEEGISLTTQEKNRDGFIFEGLN